MDGRGTGGDGEWVESGLVEMAIWLVVLNLPQYQNY